MEMQKISWLLVVVMEERLEIDEAVIRASKEFLPSISCEFDNPKLELIVGDGIEFVKNAKDEEYDIVLVDGSDPVGPAEGLFSVDFFTHCKRILKQRGIVVSQGESPQFNDKVFAELYHVFEDIFGADKSRVSLFSIPTYPTGIWSFQWGVKGEIEPTLINEELVSKFSEAHLKYYNEDIHVASFALPNYIKTKLKEKGRVEA